MWRRFKQLDPFLLAAPIILLLLSVLFIYVLTADAVGFSLALRQGVVSIIGVGLMIGLATLDYRIWWNWRLWVYLCMLALLIVVHFLGSTQFGATSWIDLKVFQLQPGELAKVLLLVVLAGILLANRSKVKATAFIQAVILALIPLTLVLLEPDFGTSLILMAMVLGVFLSARLNLLQRMLVWVSMFAMVATITLSFAGVQPFSSLLKDYQKARLASFIEPSKDLSGSGYNVQQAKIAVGSGGLMGRGLGSGSQSQLNFLPVAHADFIFAAIAESWGFLGSLLIIGLLGGLVFRIIQIAKLARDEYGQLICVGFATMLLFQMLIHIGMNIGVMPVTGIPLPFLSSGGTAIITYCLGLGLVQSVLIRSNRLT